ncbi:hypothetical protein ACFQ1Q_13470 [Winogradskyella litorisediminis]|uniref:Uncharacterized protein n=1 Tax=Winogradskyella litorisediminis TaxID=1156618 RepID=A0ABW3NCY7_9FLAO
MNRYLQKRIIDYIFRRKSLLSILYVCVVFFLRELTAISLSENIVILCNNIQENNVENWKYYSAQIVKILFTEGSLVALITTGSLILLLLILIYRGNTIKDSLDNLKSESTKASTKISKDVLELKELTKKELLRLKYPIPSELFLTGLIIKLKASTFQEFLPEIRSQFKVDERKPKDIKKFSAHEHQLQYGKYNLALQNLFDNKKIQLGLSLGDNPYKIEESHKAVFFWNYSDVLSLENDISHFHYRIENTGNKEQSFRLFVNTKDSNGKPKLGNLRIFNGLSSALDLCNKKVWLTLDIGQNIDLRPPNTTIQFISFRDNNSKDYEIEISEQKTVKLNYLKDKFPNQDFPDVYMTYIGGIIKCRSMEML